MTPAARELVLLGGGHAHLGVLRDLARRGVPPGVRVTLVSREAAAVYSGMLPGVVAGRFAAADSVVDLPGMARAAGARFLRAEIHGLDPASRQLCAEDGRSIGYDLLSIDIGAMPALVPGAAEHAIPLRPLDRFLARWEEMQRQSQLGQTPRRILVVGAGAAGVEMAMALRQGLGAAAEIALLAREPVVLAGFGWLARRLAARALRRAGIAVTCGVEAARVQPGVVIAADGRSFPGDTAIWATGAAPAAWLHGSGLALCAHGFLAVDATLRSTGDPRIFAAGDCATVLPHPRPRAGVFAVRQGPVLARNLRLALAGRAPRPFRPQRHALALLLSGPGRALAARGPLLAAEGRWVLAWKDRIDGRWVHGLLALAAGAPPR